MPDVRQVTRRYAVSARFCSFLLIQLVLYGLLSSCAHLVTISYPPEAVIHPGFNKRFTMWQGERVELALTPSLRGSAFTYLANYDQVLLANAVRQRGLQHEYKITGKGTPLIVYSKNPESIPQEKHYPTTGIVLGLTAVRENRRGTVPLLKLYDVLDPVVVRSARSPDPIAANYTATLAMLLSHGWKVANSAGQAFLRPDNPRFATGIYLIPSVRPQ